MRASLSLQGATAALAILPGTLGARIPIEARQAEPTCRSTKVAILGAGIAGVTAAQALANQSVSDFLLVEYQDTIGGRVHNQPFGKGADGKPLIVEYGANWAQGLGTPGGPENPIWTLEKKWNIANHPTNGSSVLSYNETGAANFDAEFEAWDEAFAAVGQAAGKILSENLQDMSVRDGLRLAGWKPDEMVNEMAARAVEWWLYDGEQCYSPDQSSMLFGVAVHNFTFLQFSEENNFIIDQRGHNTWIKGEASEFLAENDERLLLNTVVTNVSQSDGGVRVWTSDGGCIDAEHAICTFSVGVLQHDDVVFEPALPEWKSTAIAKFQMGTYTKIFMQFPDVFWDADTEFHLYADPYQRGWYPIFQSLDKEGFFPGSKVLFVTVVNDEARRVERQPEEKTQREIMEVLRSMFPDREVPEPDSILFPKWNSYPWARGSFSNWPPETTLEMHQNLRANVHRLWFAGEHTSAGYFGYMQGAWFEGRDVGNRVAGLLNNAGAGSGRVCLNEGDAEDACGDMMHYDTLHGTTFDDEYDVENGWVGTSFQTNGLEKGEE